MPLHVCGIEHRNPTQWPTINVNNRHIRVADCATGEREYQVFIGRICVHLVEVGETPEQRNAIFIGPHVLQEELAAIGGVSVPAMTTVAATVSTAVATALAAAVATALTLSVPTAGGCTGRTHQLCIRRLIRRCHR